MAASASSVLAAGVCSRLIIVVARFGAIAPIATLGQQSPVAKNHRVAKSAWYVFMSPQCINCTSDFFVVCLRARRLRLAVAPPGSFQGGFPSFARW
jgi:hypothetical protein